MLVSNFDISLRYEYYYVLTNPKPTKEEGIRQKWKFQFRGWSERISELSVQIE